jgi:anti-sigma factor RsiW
VRCSWMVEMVTDYLEGALSHAARTALERHLRTCEGCAAYLGQIRSTIRLTALLHRG